MITSKIIGLIERLERADIPFWQVAFLFLAASFIRGFLEVFVNSNNYGLVTGFVDIFFTYPSFFLLIFLATIVILKLSTKDSLKKISNVVAIGSFVILIPPIIDLIYHLGHPVAYNYVAGSYLDLLVHFFTFFAYNGSFGFGIKFEIALALIVTFIYMIAKTRRWLTSCFAVLAIYAVIFTALTIPVHIFALDDAFTGFKVPITERGMGDFYFSQTSGVPGPMAHTFLADSSIRTSPVDAAYINAFSIVVADSQWLIVLALLAAIAFIHSKANAISAIKNFRFGRIAHYSLLVIAGSLLASRGAPVLHGFPGLFQVMSVLTTIFAFCSAWLFSVWENDAEDLDIDSVSNQDRPLVNGSFGLVEWNIYKWAFFIPALIFGYLSGYYVLIFVLMYLLIYHLYSAPPFRLKKVIGLSSIMIGANCVLAMFAGYFAASGNIILTSFPFNIGWGAFILFALSENVKNLKDIEGDRKAGIMTLPVLLGEKWGKPVIGAIVACCAAILPLLGGYHMLTFLTGVFFGTIIFFVINRKDFREGPFFLVYIVYLIVILFEVFG